MYNVDDTVLYGTAGVCRIIEMTQKSLLGVNHQYYVLEPIYQENSKIFVPINNEKLVAKIRRILSVDEIHEIIKEVSTEDFEWIEDERERKTLYKESLDNADCRTLIHLLKNIHNHKIKMKSIGKKLYAIDERFLKDAEKLIYEEIAHVLKIRASQVLPFILEQIEIEQKK